MSNTELFKRIAEIINNTHIEIHVKTDIKEKIGDLILEKIQNEINELTKIK